MATILILCDVNVFNSNVLFEEKYLQMLLIIKLKWPVLNQNMQTVKSS